MTIAFGTYFYSPLSKKYEWSYIGNLEKCQERFNESRKTGLILRTKKNGPYVKPNMSLDEIKKDYVIVAERVWKS